MKWDPFDQAPQDAIEWFKDRVPVAVDEWSLLKEDARRKAFFVSGTTQLDVIGDVHKSLLKALEEGKSYQEWKKDIAPRLQAAWKASGTGPTTTAQINNRLGTIYQTNIQMAYQAGRYKQMTDPDVLKARPIWVFVAIRDDRTSLTCRKLNGTTLPHDDPFWIKNHPPRHIRCRSSIRSMPADTQTVTAPAGVQADPGWGTPPKMTEWADEVSKGVATGAASQTWTQAFSGNPPSARAYGLPSQLPTRPAPTAALESTPARQVLTDPLDSVLVFNPALTPLPAGVTPEMVTQTITDPTEVWLMPMVSEKKTVVYRQRHLSNYPDGLLVIETHRGVVVGVQLIPGAQAGDVRQGFLRHQTA